MTKQERAARKAEQKRTDDRLKEIHEESIRIVTAGKCPECGDALKRNLSIAGWYQCVQLGAEGFRKDASKPSCRFQCFTC
jgi:hypothetical protein